MDKGTFKRVASYSIANYFYIAVNAVSNIFVSNILGPTNNGVISYFNAINTNIDQVVYSTFRSSVERTVPQINEFKEKIEYAQQACTLNLYVSITFTFVFIVMGIFAENSLVRASAYMMALLNLTRSFADFYRIWIRSQNKISVVAVIMLITALFIPVFVIPFSYYFDLQGFWIGRTIVTCFSLGCFVYASNGLLKIVPLKRKFLRKILINGGEIVVFSLFVSGIQTMDKYFIKATIGLEQLGYYAVGSMVFTMLLMVPSSVIGAIYPKFVGIVNKDLKALVCKYSILVEMFSIFIALIAYSITPILIAYAMPKYIPSIPIVRILLIAFVSYSSVQLRYIDVIRKKRMSVLIKWTVVAFILSISMFIVTAKLTYNINHFAWCVSACFIFLSAAVNLSWSIINEYTFIQRFELFFLTLVPVFVMLPLYIGLNIFALITIVLLVFISIYLFRYKIIKM